MLIGFSWVADGGLDLAEGVLPETHRPEVAAEEEEQRALVPEGHSFQVSVLQVLVCLFILS